MSEQKTVMVGDVPFGGDNPIAFIMGPCQLENRDHAMMMAERVANACAPTGSNFVFKTSYDKANRSSITSARGIGMDEGLRILAEVRDTGIALLDRGFDAEVTSQGAPVFGASGQVIGALSIAIPAMRATADRMQAIRPALCDAAVRVTHAVGGHLPEAHAAKWRTAARPQPDPGGTP